MLNQFSLYNFSEPTTIEYLKTVHNYHLSQSQQLGFFGERFVRSELQDRGYCAVFNPDFNAPYDILVNDTLPVEVKTGTKTTRDRGRQRYQFKLTSKLLRQDYIFCLVAIDDFGELFTYVIPSAFIGDRVTISITSHPSVYKGQWKQYQNAWHNIELVRTWRYKYQQIAHGQLSLFDITVTDDVTHQVIQ